MVKNNLQIILPSGILLASILGMLFLTTTPFLSDYADHNNFYRIWFNGRSKLKFEVLGSVVTISGDASDFNNPDFPTSVPILTLIGMSIIIVGSIYWSLLGFTGNNCFVTARKAPGPLTGILALVGGLIGFIGIMIFLGFGNKQIDKYGSGLNYAFGYVVSAIIFGIFLLIGIGVIILSFSKPTKKKKKKRKKR